MHIILILLSKLLKKIVLRSEIIDVFLNIEFHELVFPETTKFFQDLNFHPDYWNKRKDFRRGNYILSMLSVMKHVAKGGVKLM